MSFSIFVHSADDIFNFFFHPEENTLIFDIIFIIMVNTTKLERIGSKADVCNS